MINTRAAKLESLGYSLGEAPTPGAVYKPVTVAGRIAYVSGAVPVEAGSLKYRGKVPSEVPLEEARKAAALCAANNLRMVYHVLGSLETVKRGFALPAT